MRNRKASRTSPPHSANWTPEQVRDLLTNPVYGYGIVLEPTEAVTTQVQQLERTLAQERKERGRPFSTAEMDRRFQALFRQLVENGICRRGPNAPPTIGKEEWLKAQQVAIERLAGDESESR